MDIAILTTICICLVVHRYLSTFWAAGNLPFAHGFSLFVWLQTVACLINFIWILGFVVGLVVALLTFFQVVYGSFLWPFLVPELIRDNKKSDLVFMLSKNKPSEWLYGGWTLLIIGLFILAVINFFVGQYASSWDILLELVDGDYRVLIFYSLVGIATGNLLRMITMKLVRR